MPAQTTRNTIVRQWELLKLLPSHGAGKSAGELAQALLSAGFPVSKRQVERDLNALRESFPVECNDKGIPHGWRWVEGASSDLPGISLAEALSLHLIEAMLRPLLPASVLQAVVPRFQQATKKLATLGQSNRTANWPDKVRTVMPTLPLLPPKIPTQVIECVQDALLADDQIEVGYQAMGKVEATTLTLSPFGLIQRGPVTYLVATAFSYTDPRLYAVHRIGSVKRLFKKIETKSDLDLDAFIQSGGMQFGGGEIIRFEARVSTGLARILVETPISGDQQLVSDEGGAHLNATVRNTSELHWWVMSMGAGIEVLQPLELRAVISAHLRDAAARYVE